MGGKGVSRGSPFSFGVVLFPTLYPLWRCCFAILLLLRGAAFSSPPRFHVILLIHHFHFNFRLLWIHAAGLPEALHSYLHFFLIQEFPHLCCLILNLC